MERAELYFERAQVALDMVKVRHFITMPPNLARH